YKTVVSGYRYFAHEVVGRRVGRLCLHVGSEPCRACPRGALAKQWRAALHATGRTLLDGGPTRVVRPMAAGPITALRFDPRQQKRHHRSGKVRSDDGCSRNPAWISVKAVE